MVQVGRQEGVMHSEGPVGRYVGVGDTLACLPSGTQKLAGESTPQACNASPKWHRVLQTQVQAWGKLESVGELPHWKKCAKVGRPNGRHNMNCKKARVVCEWKAQIQNKCLPGRQVIIIIIIHGRRNNGNKIQPCW